MAAGAAGRTGRLLDAPGASRFAVGVLERDRSVAVGVLLRAADRLAALAFGLGAAGGAAAGWAWARGAPAAALVLGLSALVLLASGAVASLQLARLAGLGFCGIWQAHLASRLVRLEVVALVAGAALAALGMALG